MAGNVAQPDKSVALIQQGIAFEMARV